MGPWLWLLPVLWSGARAADYPLEIIGLRARPPEDVIPILAPLAGPDGSIVGANNALFVRASPAHLADIRRALAALDQPARNLLIQVRQQGDSASRAGGAAAGSDERFRDMRVRVGPPSPSGSRFGAWAGEHSERRDLAQEVRALDGHEAFITIGEEQPLPYRELTTGRDGAVFREGTAYRRAASGFYVVPRVQGDQVTLELAARSQRPGPRGALETSAVQGRIQGRLGDWIPVALSTDAQGVRDGGLIYYGESSRAAEHRVELRVLPLD